jgi:hypothetical protein
MPDTQISVLHRGFLQQGDLFDRPTKLI